VRCRTLALVVALAFVVGCGGHQQQRPPKTTSPTPHTARVIGPVPGSLVAIGGGRSLFVHCVGSGTPTVVLEAGFGANAADWREVQPQLGRHARTCAYDRAGIGSSVAPPGVRDARDDVGDLQRLLHRAHVQQPYVLVGHSYGGLLARLFAKAHPTQVAGMVLVDAMGRDQTRRVLAIWPKDQARAVRRMIATPVRDGVDLAAGEALARRVQSLGDLPLAVVTAGRHDAEWGHVPRRLARALDRQWTTMQDELAALSTDSVHVVALRSDHPVQHGQPGVVISAVLAVLAAARDHTALGPCRRVFAGPGVRCRG
jgi:pimeloyl-ACP methyl ester carboxylesterase